jgi:tetratricopeptide (TPR) repeat protein
MLFNGTGKALAQAGEQEGPPPELLLSNAMNYWISADDKKKTGGDPENDYRAAIHEFFRYLDAKQDAAFEDTVRVYNKLANSYNALAEIGAGNNATALWDSCLTYYQWLIDRNPETEYLAGNYLFAGYATWQTQGLDAAVPYYAKYVELEPDDLPQREFLIRSYVSQGNLEEACNHALVYLEKDASNQDNVGTLNTLRGRMPHRWEEITLKLVELRPDTPIYLLDMARHNYEMGNNEQTVNYASQFVALEAGNIDGWKFLGDAHKRLGNYREALQAFDRILAIDSRDMRAHADKASVYLEQNNLPRAWRSAGSALRIDSDYGYANAVMGDAAYRWIMQEFNEKYPGRELERLPYNMKKFIKDVVVDVYYEKAQQDPEWRNYATGQINYLTQFYPQPQDNFMAPPEEKVEIVFPPPGL